jgi:small-conductance mechanosensitive channel
MPICRLILLSLVLTVGLASHVSLEAQAPPAGVDQDVATAPVELDGAVLFHVRGTSSFPAEARARVIQERIEAVARDASVQVDSLQVVQREGTLQIVAGDRLIVGVVEADAGLEGVTAAELAVAHLIRLRQAVADYRVARSAPALRRSALATVAATFLFVLSIGVAVWFWRGLDRRLTARFHARVHTVGIQSFEVMRADRIWRALRSGLYGLRTLVLIAISLTYVAYVLARWPWTRGLSRDLVAVALDPLELIGRGVVAHIPSLVFLAVLFYVFRFCLKVLRLFFEAVGRGTVTLGGFDAEWAQPTYKIVRVAVVAFGLIVAYPYIPGSQSAAFKGVSLFIGVVFSLGSSSAISNIIAGYMMTYRRAFKVGDRVKIGDSIGDVIEMRLQVTHLRSLKNEEIVIPNSQILAGEVVNYSSLARTHGLLLHTEVGIGYETSWRQVEAMLLAAAARTPGLQSEPRPFVLMKKLGDFCVTYELNVSCGDARAALELYTAMHGHILDIFNEYGVQIMTPAYMSDPVQPKVVAPGDWYAPPASQPAVAPIGPRQPDTSAVGEHRPSGPSSTT